MGLKPPPSIPAGVTVKRLVQAIKRFEELAERLEELLILLPVPTVYALTGDEVVRCLERLKLSTIYYLDPSDYIAAGESTVFEIRPPPKQYCIVATGYIMTSLHYYTSCKVEYADWAGVVRWRRNIERVFPAHERIPVKFIFCEPRTLYRFEFYNRPTAPESAWVGVSLECNVVTEDVYKVIGQMILRRVFKDFEAVREKIMALVP